MDKTGCDGFIKRAADNAGIGFFGIADQPAFVGVLGGNAEIGDRRDILVWNIPFPLASMLLNLAPLLRRVVSSS